MDYTDGWPRLCIGDSSQCQFIRNSSSSDSDWIAAFLPWPATSLYIRDNVTCVSDGLRVFCTGCISSGCICRVDTTVTDLGKIVTIEIDLLGVCVHGVGSSKCFGTVSKQPVDTPRCMLNTDANVIQCSNMTFAVSPAVIAYAVATVSDYVVFTSVSNICVSDNLLRSVTCTKFKQRNIE